MFLKFLKSKKGKGSKEMKVHTKEEMDDDKGLSRESLPQRRSSPLSVPRTPLRVQSLSRLGQYSHSRASSSLSVSSDSRSISVASRASSSSVKSNKSTRSYEIDRFSGTKSVPKKMKSMGYQDVWAQAYAFGGR